jgi:anti-sigma-K factor RskA
MNCRKVKQQLSLYAGMDLTAGEHQTVKEHINSCAACNKEVARYRAHHSRLAELASDKQDNPVSPFFWQGIQKAILLEENKPVKIPFYRRPLFVSAVAAAAAIAVTAYLVINFMPETNRKTPLDNTNLTENKTKIEVEMLPMPTPRPLYRDTREKVSSDWQDKTETIEF